MKLALSILLALTLSGCVIPGDIYGAKSGGSSTLICHKGKKTMELPPSAVDAHLGHGDRRGAC